MKLNEEWKREWLEALRGGSYKQGQMYLRTGNEFCCLGVACDLAAAKGLGTWATETDYFYPTQGSAEQYGLPFEIMEVMFSDLADGEELDTGQSGSGPLPFEVLNDGALGRKRAFLADLNDVGLTFAQIADLIEYFY